MHTIFFFQYSLHIIYIKNQEDEFIMQWPLNTIQIHKCIAEGGVSKDS